MGIQDGVPRKGKKSGGDKPNWDTLYAYMEMSQ
jgi:hypothetical protein